MPNQIPVQCAAFPGMIDSLNQQLENLQNELENASPVDKPRLIKLILAKQLAVDKAENDFQDCLDHNLPPAPPPGATMPLISTDTSLQPVQKIIPWALVQKKMDEFFNLRTHSPVFKIRLSHHDYIAPGTNVIDNDPPASDVTISMIEAAIDNGQVTTSYKPMFTQDLGRLDSEYYFDDIDSDSITVELTPSASEPITIKINFECNGPTEAPTTNHLLPDLDMEEFYITLRLSFDVLRVPAAPPSQCMGIKNNLDELNAQLENLQEE
jgi:hypothetical protein